MAPGISVWRTLNIPEPEMPKRLLLPDPDGVTPPLKGLVTLESLQTLTDRAEAKQNPAVTTAGTGNGPLMEVMDQDKLIYEPDEQQVYSNTYIFKKPPTRPLFHDTPLTAIVPRQPP